jgi:F-type H+-transporting ATPase subunit b
MEALGINGGYLAVQIVNFLILIIVLRVWVYGPVLSLLEKRRETIAQGLEDARIAAEARANAEKDAEQIKADANTKSTEIVREATVRAEDATKDIRTAAEADAVRIREEANADAQQERVRVLGDLRSQVAALAMAAAQKLVGEALTQERQHALINEFFSGVKAGKVVVLEGEAVAGDSAEVTSALTLTETEQEAVKNDVLAKVGGQASVTFRVDPSILGGLVIRVGDKVIDGSVSGQLGAMRENLR